MEYVDIVGDIIFPAISPAAPHIEKFNVVEDIVIDSVLDSATFTLPPYVTPSNVYVSSSSTSAESRLKELKRIIHRLSEAEYKAKKAEILSFV